MDHRTQKAHLLIFIIKDANKEQDEDIHKGEIWLGPKGKKPLSPGEEAHLPSGAWAEKLSAEKFRRSCFLGMFLLWHY